MGSLWNSNYSTTTSNNEDNKAIKDHSLLKFSTTTIPIMDENRKFILIVLGVSNAIFLIEFYFLFVKIICIRALVRKRKVGNFLNLHFF